MRNLRVERRRATLERRREDDGDGSHRVVGGAFDGERDAFHALTAVKRRDGDGEDIFVTTYDVATGAARVDRGRAPVEESIPRPRKEMRHQLEATRELEKLEEVLQGFRGACRHERRRVHVIESLLRAAGRRVPAHGPVAK